MEGESETWRCAAVLKVPADVYALSHILTALYDQRKGSNLNTITLLTMFLLSL